MVTATQRLRVFKPASTKKYDFNCRSSRASGKKREAEEHYSTTTPPKKKKQREKETPT